MLVRKLKMPCPETQVFPYLAHPMPNLKLYENTFIFFSTDTVKKSKIKWGSNVSKALKGKLNFTSNWRNVD
jgi:hypothetical protein